MFEKTSQRVCFAIGCFFLIVFALSGLEHFAKGNWIEGVFGTTLWYTLVAVFWHFTNVLNPVLNWLKKGT